MAESCDKRMTEPTPVILVVDDDPTVCMLCEESLEATGNRVISVGSYEEAMTALQRIRPNAILLDVQLPGTDGFAILNDLRQRPQTEDTPIVMITGLDDAASIQRACQSGATDFVTKPINWLILEQRIQYILRADRNSRALRASERRLARAQAVAGFGSWEWNVSTHDVRWSNEVGTILGVPHRMQCGSMDSLVARVHPEDQDNCRAWLQSMVEYRETQQLDFRIVRDDGHIRHLCGHGEVISELQANSVLVTGTLLDITERKRTETMMGEARDRAMETSRLKSEFLANMSHELRTPLNGILGLVDLLQNTALTEEQRERLDTLEHCGEALLARVNDVLDLSKSEAGKLELRQEAFDPEQVLVNVLQTVTPLAEEKYLKLIREGRECVLGTLQGDADRLQQVLLNLLGNAIKFTEEGEVALSLEVLSEASDSVRLRFQVRDTGMGIPADELDDVFEAFTQVDGSTTRRHGGTGLGLAICRSLIEGMGGTLGVESTLGQGSTFWFEVDLKRDAAEAAPGQSPSQRDAA